MKTNSWTNWAVIAAVIASVGASLRAAPVNDLFANRIPLTGTNLTVTGSNAGATAQSGEPAHAGEDARASVWWTWTAPRDGWLTVSTAGSDFDTIVAVYTGSAVNGLTEAAANDDENYSAGIYTSRAQGVVSGGVTYQIAVDGYDGETGSVQLALTLNPLPAAPAWTCYDLDGQSVWSTNFSGKVIVLDFWATWCGPCKAEIPDFIAMQNLYGPDGLVIIGLSVDSGGSQLVKDFVQTNGINYTSLMANSAVQSAFGGIQYIPTTFIIDRDNVIRAKYVGSQSRSVFERAIRPLLYNKQCVQARCAGGQMVLAWPANAAQFLLESTPSLTTPLWSTNAAAPQVLDGMNTLTLPATQTSRFYRLRLPN